MPPSAEPLRIERTFAAPAPVVFEAWISVDVLRRWWPAGPDWVTTFAEVDARVGGSMRLVMRAPDGTEFGGQGRYLEITAPTRLVFSWQWDATEPDATPQVVEVTFTENPDLTTTAVLINRGLTAADVQSHLEGWQASFDNLDRALAEDGAIAPPAPAGQE